MAVSFTRSCGRATVSRCARTNPLHINNKTQRTKNTTWRPHISEAAALTPMLAEDVVGMLFLLEGLVVLWSVLASFAALRTMLWCCGLVGRPPHYQTKAL